MIFPQPPGWVKEWAPGQWDPFGANNKHEKFSWRFLGKKFPRIYDNALWSNTLSFLSIVMLNGVKWRKTENSRRTATVLTELCLNTTPPLYCQMTIIKQFSNKFDVLYSRENNTWTGENNTKQNNTVPRKQWSTLPMGCLGKSKIYRIK